MFRDYRQIIDVQVEAIFISIRWGKGVLVFLGILTEV